MSRRSNKFVVHVNVSRAGTETVIVRGSGRFGRNPLSLAPQYLVGVPLSRVDTPAHYWADELARVVAKLNTL
jgi:hypothetical protein